MGRPPWRQPNSGQDIAPAKSGIPASRRNYGDVPPALICCVPFDAIVSFLCYISNHRSRNRPTAYQLTLFDGLGKPSALAPLADSAFTDHFTLRAREGTARGRGKL